MYYLNYFSISNFFDNSFNGLCGSMGVFRVNTSQVWALTKSLLTTIWKNYNHSYNNENLFWSGLQWHRRWHSNEMTPFLILLAAVQPSSKGSLSCFGKEPWLRLVTWLPKSGSQNYRRGRRVNDCRYDKRYSSGTREEFAAEFIISWSREYLKMSTTPEKVVLHYVRERTLGTTLAIYLVYRHKPIKKPKRKIERFHSRDQHLRKFIRTKESVYIRKEFNSQRIGLGHQHGRRFIVLKHQYGRRDVMWKRSFP